MLVGIAVLVTVGDELAVAGTVGVAVATCVGVLVGTVIVPVPVGTGVLVETAVAVAEVALVAVDVAEPEGPDVAQGTGVGVSVGWAGVDAPGALSDPTFTAYTLYGRVRPTTVGVGVMHPAEAMPACEGSMVSVARSIAMPAAAMPRIENLAKQTSFREF